MRYRDLLLNEQFSDAEIKIILGIANGIMRWLKRPDNFAYSNMFFMFDYKDDLYMSKLSRKIYHQISRNWIRREHTDYWKYAMWEVYWLMRGTTAREAAEELTSDSPAN